MSCEEQNDNKKCCCSWTWTWPSWVHVTRTLPRYRHMTLADQVKVMVVFLVSKMKRTKRTRAQINQACSAATTWNIKSAYLFASRCRWWIFWSNTRSRLADREPHLLEFSFIPGIKRVMTISISFITLLKILHHSFSRYMGFFKQRLTVLTLSLGWLGYSAIIVYPANDTQKCPFQTESYSLPPGE